ncbi:recombinase family protein [bacterium]|nr:MAG: recombinase family protein [bacterium]
MDNYLYIYVRVSTEKQVEKETSLPEQINRGKIIADNLGLKPLIFEEKGKSASLEDLSNRPQMEKIVKAIKSGSCKHLFCNDLTRISRHKVTQAYIHNELRKNKVMLYTCDKSYNLSKIEDSLSLGFMENFAEYEGEMRKFRFKMGYIANSKKGRFLKNIPSYGYFKNSQGFLEVDIEESRVLNEIISLYLQGWGTTKIADYLNNNLVQTKTSKIFKNGYILKSGESNRKQEIHKQQNQWNPGTILTMLKNESYLGKRKFKVSEKEYEYVNCPQLVTEATFNQIKEQIKLNGKDKRKESKYYYMLKLLLTCGNCGAAMHGRVKPNRSEYTYRCSSKRTKQSSCSGRGISISKLETLIWEAYTLSSHYLNEIFSELRNIDSGAFEVESNIQNIQFKINNLQKQVESIQKKKYNLLNKMIDPEFSEFFPVEEMREQIEKEEENINRNLREANTELNKFNSQLKSNVQVNDLDYLDNLLNEISIEHSKIAPPFLDVASQNKASKLLRNSIKNITVSYSVESKQHTIEVEFKPIQELRIDNNKEEYDDENVPAYDGRIINKELPILKTVTPSLKKN